MSSWMGSVLTTTPLEWEGSYTYKVVIIYSQTLQETCNIPVVSEERYLSVR